MPMQCDAVDEAAELAVKKARRSQIDKYFELLKDWPAAWRADDLKGKRLTVGLPEEEVREELEMAMVEAAGRFDPARDVKLTAFAWDRCT